MIHLCNTFFEWELEQEHIPDLEKAFQQNSTFLQLQFLPLLYAGKHEPILVTDFPKDIDHPFALLKNPPKEGTINSWGYSRAISQWAKKHHLTYTMPSWETIKKINSKAYSFAVSPLPGSALIKNMADAAPFLLQNYVWKSCFGTAGRGHFFSKNAKLSSLLEKEWKKGLPVIAEPWVDRVCDFSTQWEITHDQEILFLGVAFLHNTSLGTYRGNSAGNVKQEAIFAKEILAQKKISLNVLKEIAAEGYFGEVGIDAMIYKKGREIKLQPIVEINARKTMGWVCLMLQKRLAPKGILTLEYTSDKDQSNNLLPSFLERMNGQKINFPKQLGYKCEINDS